MEILNDKNNNIEQSKSTESIFGQAYKELKGDENIGNDLFDLPAVSSKDKEDVFSLEIDVVGYQKEDIRVSVTQGSLVISGEDKLEEEKLIRNGNNTNGAIIAKNFQRVFELPKNLDDKNIAVDFENETLKITIPRLGVS